MLKFSQFGIFKAPLASVRSIQSYFVDMEKTGNWILFLLRGQSNENKYMQFLIDLDSLGLKSMKKDKKWPSPYVK